MSKNWIYISVGWLSFAWIISSVSSCTMEAEKQMRIQRVELAKIRVYAEKEKSHDAKDN